MVIAYHYGTCDQGNLGNRRDLYAYNAVPVSRGCNAFEPLEGGAKQHSQVLRRVSEAPRVDLLAPCRRFTVLPSPRVVVPACRPVYICTHLWAATTLVSWFEKLKGRTQSMASVGSCSNFTANGPVYTFSDTSRLSRVSVGISCSNGNYSDTSRMM